MKARAALVGLSLATCGCAGFTSAGPATFREPAARMAEAWRRSAEAPAFRAAIPAESLHDVRIAGSRALLDYRSEGGASDSFLSLPTCGPLELRDVTANERVWSVERAGPCDDQILAILPRLAIRGVREEGGKAGLFLSTLALDSGALVAKVPLEKDALVVPSGDALVVVQGVRGAQRVSLRDGDRLEEKWGLALDDAGAATEVVTLNGSVLVFGGSVTSIERATGKKVGSSSLGADAVTLDVVAAGDAAYALIAREKKEMAIARVGADGKVAWTAVTSGIVAAATPSGPLTMSGDTVTALKASDGTAAWSAKLPGAATGAGLVVQRGQGSWWLVPHTRGVTALDVASGAVRFSASPFDADEGAPHATDRLRMAGPDLVVLDAARGVAGLDLASDGRARYAIAVRSLPHVHRRGRMAALRRPGADAGGARGATSVGEAAMDTLAGLSNATGGGLVMGTAQMSVAAANYTVAMGQIGFAAMETALEARRAQQATIAQRQARLDEESPFILRAISWSTGRGVLVIRKSDGAFHEVVTGPPDVYEDAFRPASVAAFVPLAKKMLVFSEGLDPSTWEDSQHRAPVKLVARSLLGYAIDEAAFHPAAEYEQRSVVPAGELTALDAGAPEAAPPATSAPVAPSSATCKTHLDCKGGLVCPKGQCVAPACVADRDCGAGSFCSLEGVCEPLKR